MRILYSCFCSFFFMFLFPTYPANMKIRPRRKTIPANNPRTTATGIEIINQNNPIRKICLGLVEFFFGACKARGETGDLLKPVSLLQEASPDNRNVG